MAYTTPSTQPTGTLITSTMYKAHLVDNIKFLHGPPTVRVARDAAYAIPASAWEEIPFDTEDWDSNLMWSSTAATKVFCRTAGKFSWACNGGFASSTVGVFRGIALRKNSTSGDPTEGGFVDNDDFPSGAAARTYACSGMVSLTTGQYVQLVMFQDTGGTLNSSTLAHNQPRLSMFWVSS